MQSDFTPIHVVRRTAESFAFGVSAAASSASVQGISFDDNAFTALPVNPAFGNYESVTFRNNAITSIDPAFFNLPDWSNRNALSPTRTSLNVNISGNAITAIPPGGFTQFSGPSLWVGLENNQISSLDSAAFRLTGSDDISDDVSIAARTISLSNNSITTLGATLFSEFYGMTLAVILDQNRIANWSHPVLARFKGSNLIMVARGCGVREVTASTFQQSVESSGSNHSNHSSAVFIDFSNNDLSELTDRIFSKFEGPQLSVRLSGNNITSLLGLPFDGFLGNILFVDLSHNRIGSLPPFGGFIGASFQLNLSHNLISDLRVDVPPFDDFTVRSTCAVDISHNQLTETHLKAVFNSYSRTFADLTVDASFNHVGALLNNTFAGVGVQVDSHPNLDIGLSNNRITVVEPGVFLEFGGSSLVMDLSNNPMLPVPGLATVPEKFEFTANNPESGSMAPYRFNFLSLDLHSTGIDARALTALRCFVGSELIINIAGNSVSSQSVATIAPLLANSAGCPATAGRFNITSLDLSNNSIAGTLPTGAFVRNIKTVLLRGNSLTAVDAGAFDGVESVDLSANQVSELSTAAFGSTLTSLNLSSNRITVLSSVLLDGMPLLTAIDVSFNDLQWVPLTNNHILSASLAVGNALQCSAYAPVVSVLNCRCPANKVFAKNCGYGGCSPHATGCENADEFPLCNGSTGVTQCAASCPLGQYLSLTNTSTKAQDDDEDSQETFDFVSGVCKPLTDCLTVYVTSSVKGTTQGYQIIPNTATSDRECSLCTTCPQGYVASACTVSSDSVCSKDTALTVSQIILIVLVVIGVLAVVSWWGFRHRVQLKQAMVNLRLRDDRLEMTTLLLDEEKAEAEQVNQSWQIAWNDVALMEVLGRGAFGVVNRAEWMGSIVAVKQLRMGLVDNESESFKQEARTMRGLHHPNLVAFFGTGTQPQGSPFLVTELMHRTLRELLEAQGDRLTWVERRRYCADILSGMSYLHSRTPPMIHRDLKSDNCLVGDNTTIKVADFGTVTRPQKETGSVSSSSEIADGSTSAHYAKMVRAMSIAVGTPMWMAPEVLQGAHGFAKYGPLVDVYSFGIVMYEIGTGKMPYNDFDELFNSGEMQAHELLDLIAEGTRPAVPPGIPPPYLALMCRCWSGDPSERPPFREARITVSQMEL